MPCRRSMADLNASASSDNTLRGCRKAAPCFSPYSVVSLSLPPVMLRRACPNMGILGGQHHEACHWSGSGAKSDRADLRGACIFSFLTAPGRTLRLFYPYKTKKEQSPMSSVFLLLVS